MMLSADLVSCQLVKPVLPVGTSVITFVSPTIQCVCACLSVCKVCICMCAYTNVDNRGLPCL